MIIIGLSLADDAFSCRPFFAQCSSRRAEKLLTALTGLALPARHDTSLLLLCVRTASNLCIRGDTIDPCHRDHPSTAPLSLS